MDPQKRAYYITAFKLADNGQFIIIREATPWMDDYEFHRTWWQRNGYAIIGFSALDA